MADLEFDVVPRRREPITFRLTGDDHEYVFTPPKNAAMLLPILDTDGATAALGVTKATFDWLGGGLSKEDNDRLLGRLRDPEDDLDVSTMEKIVEGLVEKVSSRPTS